MAEAPSGHRVPLRAGFGRHPDPERSSDPAVQRVLTALATLPTPAPRAHFRAELRAQLVAVAPRLVADGLAEQEAAGYRGAPQRRLHLRLAAGIRVAVAMLVVGALLLSGAVWLSRSALPGDALYGLKRAGEDAQLALAGDAESRARDLLGFAKTRADEVGQLLGQPSGAAAGPQADGISAQQASLIRSTLGSADDDLRQASRLLGTQAVHDRSAGPLQILLQWAPGQQGRLQAAAARIPAGALHQRAVQSADLVATAQARARALAANLHCSCVGDAGSDGLGPRPCAPCHVAPAAGTGTGTTAPSTAPQHTPGGTGTSPSPAGTTATNGGSSGSGTSGGSGSGSTTPVLPVPPPTLPGLPLPTLSVPTTLPTASPIPTCTPLTLGTVTLTCATSLGI